MKVKIVIHRRGDHYKASCPALPECTAVGDTPDEAAEALEEDIRRSVQYLVRHPSFPGEGTLDYGADATSLS